MSPSRRFRRSWQPRTLAQFEARQRRLRNAWRVAMLAALTVLALVLSWLALHAVSNARGASLSAGQTLQRPSASLALHREKREWVWGVWDCRFYAGVSTLQRTPTFDVIQLDGGYLLCVWSPGHWATLPVELRRARHVAGADVAVLTSH